MFVLRRFGAEGEKSSKARLTGKKIERAKARSIFVDKLLAKRVRYTDCVDKFYGTRRSIVI